MPTTIPSNNKKHAIIIKSKKLINKFSIALMALVIIAPFLFSQVYFEKINYAVALKDVPLYEGPSKIFTEKGIISRKIVID